MDLEEAKDTFYRGCGDSTDKYRAHYRAKYNAETTLTDDEIVMLVCNADDDHDPHVWAELMFKAQNEKAGAAA